MPGAEKEQVFRSMQLADRVSVNLEAPNTHRLQLLAPLKQFANELVKPLQWVEEIRKTQPAYLGWNGRWPSSVTQFVVGAVGESDLELLTATDYLYRQAQLRRTYFSPFNPIEDTPLEHVPPESPVREHRLYQASFLLRDYGFSLEELPFLPAGELPRTIDPKTAWAQTHLAEQPIEINRASRLDLLRIPGIGPRGAEAILKARRECSFRHLSQLHKLGLHIHQLAPYVLLNGKHLAHQMRLF
jgi:predicted DNA-binding helix-hairpin-helix protein